MGIGERLFSRIAGTAQADEAMHGVALCFYGLALLQSVLGAISGQSAIAVDALLLVFLAFHMHRHRSRAFALGLLVVALLALTSTMLNRVGNPQGGSNVFLAVVSVYFGWRAAYATFVFHRAEGSRTDWRVALLKNIAGVAVLGMFIVLIVAVGRLGATIGPRQTTLLSVIQLLAVMLYCLPFSSWFPILGGRPLVRREG